MMSITNDSHAAQQRLEQRALELDKTAETISGGDERDALLHRARKMETASRTIDGWLSSQGLRSPK